MTWPAFALPEIRHGHQSWKGKNCLTFPRLSVSFSSNRTADPGWGQRGIGTEVEWDTRSWSVGRQLRNLHPEYRPHTRRESIRLLPQTTWQRENFANLSDQLVMNSARVSTWYFLTLEMTSVNVGMKLPPHQKKKKKNQLTVLWRRCKPFQSKYFIQASMIPMCHTFCHSTFKIHFSY